VERDIADDDLGEAGPEAAPPPGEEGEARGGARAADVDEHLEEEVVGECADAIRSSACMRTGPLPGTASFRIWWRRWRAGAPHRLDLHKIGAAKCNVPKAIRIQPCYTYHDFRHRNRPMQPVRPTTQYHVADLPFDRASYNHRTPVFQLQQ
jgi:hypothetical protein